MCVFTKRLTLRTIYIVKRTLEASKGKHKLIEYKLVVNLYQELNKNSRNVNLIFKIKIVIFNLEISFRINTLSSYVASLNYLKKNHSIV